MNRARRNPRPFDAASLHDTALAYVARFATSQARLEAYLRRKLRERGWDGDGEPDIAGLAQRLVQAGYVDDQVYAETKSGSLLRRGYGARRINQALGAAGIDESLRGEMQPGEADARKAALALARRRRFGPFGGGVADPARRERQIAAMLRAGHPLDKARELINAATVDAAEEWADAADEE